MAEAATVAADTSSKEDGEAVAVLERAHELLKAEMAAVAGTPSGRQGGPAVLNVAGGGSRGVEEIRRQTAQVLDTLSEAYAGKRRWEQARWASYIAGIRSFVWHRVFVTRSRWSPAELKLHASVPTSRKSVAALALHHRSPPPSASNHP